MNQLISQQNSLRHLSDARLLEDLRLRIQRERELLAEILRYLYEVERRKLFLNRGYSSLFAFCMGELAYSERQAHTRIQAMRLIKSVPEAEEKLASGELSLSVAAAAQSSFCRSMKAVLPINLSMKKEIVAQLSNTSVRKAEQILLRHIPVLAIPNERTKTVAAEVTRIEFNASLELMAKFNKLKKLTAHKNFDGNWGQLFEILADVGLKQLEPKVPPPLTTPQVVEVGYENSTQQKRGGHPRLAPSQVLITRGRLRVPKSRHIPNAVKRFVWNRDNGKCQFKDLVTGRRCESEHAVQYDHVRRFSDGGGHEAGNLRLMCAAHNRWRL